ncbi:MAG: GNAT family N-acetyltransferase [Alphaproteobacteria bacterium]|nr:GNAT family N-acetyltransferase [Alphaproteobacteria bacterium]MDP6517172.1 GNAT family N-acetyltransferase [Alphaproteobacteria bacterium]
MGADTLTRRNQDPEPRGLTARTITRIDEISPAAWGACAGADNPFVSHSFLDALEQSGSCTAETGWLPRHLILEDADGRLIGAMPMYLKGHSYGEYVFDHGWADAYEHAGGRYYPKLQASIPFTPATGPRLLVPPGPEAPARRDLMLRAAIRVADRLEVSSLHITFPTEDEWKLMGAAGLLQRTGEQFHWENRGYADFDEFLATLNARKRKTIRKERARAMAGGIEIETLTGAALRPEHWDTFYEFYIDTGSRKWGSPYLTREFFHLIGRTMADRIALIMCRRDGRYIAGALNLIGTETLFGRNWGCVETHDCLHFEACYYRAIDFAIVSGLKRVEAGAQGPHKIQRGYLPQCTYSAHWIRDAGFRQAVEDYLVHERREIDWHLEAVARDYSPYRKPDGRGACRAKSLGHRDCGPD